MRLEPDAGAGWPLRALILVSGVPSSLAYTVVGPMLAKISAALAHGPTDAYMVKMISGVIGPAMVVGGGLGGLLADKLDRRPVMALSGLIVAIAGAAPALLNSLPAILITRFIMGVAAVVMATIGVAMVAEAFDEARRPGWIGAVVTVDLVAAIVSLPIAGVVADVGWRDPFLMYLCGFPVAALSLFAIPRPPPRGSHQPAPCVEARNPAAMYPMGLIALGLVIGALVTIPGIYISFYLRNLGVERSSTVGVILMLNAAAAVLVTALYGRVRHRLSPEAIFCASFGVMAVAIAMLALARNSLTAVAALLVMGAGMGWLNPNLMSQVIDAVEPSHRGRALGAVRASAAIAPALGVTALQPLVDTIGVNFVYLLTAGLAALMFFGMLARELQRRSLRGAGEA